MFTFKKHFSWILLIEINSVGRNEYLKLGICDGETDKQANKRNKKKMKRINSIIMF